MAFPTTSERAAVYVKWATRRRLGGCPRPTARGPSPGIARGPRAPASRPRAAEPACFARNRTCRRGRRRSRPAAEIAELPVALDEAQDRGGLALLVRHEGRPRPRRNRYDRHPKAPVTSVGAGRRRHVVVPPAAVVPRHQGCSIAVVAAGRIAAARALQQRHVDRRHPRRAAVGELARVIGVGPRRRHECDLRQLAVRDVGEHRRHRHRDVRPRRAIPDVADCVVDVLPIVEHRPGAAA